MDLGLGTPGYEESPEFLYRLIDYTGSGFLFGAGAGSAFHFIRGFRSSPSGGRLVAGVRAVRANGPRVAGRWSAYLAVFCAFETAAFLARRRVDPWDSIAAGAATGGLFSMCRGPPAAARSALLGATLVAGSVGVVWATEHTQHLFDSRTGMNRESPAPGTGTPRPMPDA